MLTNEQLRAIAEIAEKATPGPWKWEGTGNIGFDVYVGDGGKGSGVAHGQFHQNARFIVATRDPDTGYAAVAAELLRLREQLEAAEKERERLRQCMGLFSTAKPDMVMDPDNPENMAHEVVAYCDALRAALARWGPVREVGLRLIDQRRAWLACFNKTPRESHVLRAIEEEGTVLRRECLAAVRAACAPEQKGNENANT